MKTPQTQTGLLTDQEFRAKLTERVAEASENGHSFAVLVCVPQRLPGEGVTEIIDVAAGCLRSLMRQEDLGGLLDGEVLVAGLYNTDAFGARVLADRLQSDLRLRSYHRKSTIWDAGLAYLPKNGASAEELLAAAIDAARNRRRRLADTAAALVAPGPR